MNPVIEMTWEAGADVSFGLPAYATTGAAGADLRANFPDRADVTLQPGGRALIGTGLRLAIPTGYEVQIRPRSGLALKFGITLANAPGTIDSDYRGPLGVILLNTGTEAYIKNCPLIEVLSCTLRITSANNGAQDTTFILEVAFFNGIVSDTISSVNAEFSIFS